VIGATAKAVTLLHGDGAAVSVVGLPDNMDARAFVVEEGFDEFSRTAGLALRADGGFARASYDREGLGIAGGAATSAVAAEAIVAGAFPWDPRPALLEASARLRARPPAARGAAGDDNDPERASAPSGLSDAARILADELASARGPVRSPDGIHGAGPFGDAFRRLRAGPGFPADLVGFGPGSTPAGDDWIAGYLTGRDLLEGGPRSSEPELRSALEAALPRTTPAGRALLAGAIAGAPPAYLVELAIAAAAAKADERRLREAARAALGHGASSGEDAMAGFLDATGYRGQRPDAL